MPKYTHIFSQTANVQLCQIIYDTAAKHHGVFKVRPLLGTYFLTWFRCRSARWQRISGIARWTTADRVVWGNAADGLYSARAGTGVSTFLLDASLVRWTIAVDDTFWKRKLIQCGLFGLYLYKCCSDHSLPGSFNVSNCFIFKSWMFWTYFWKFV